MIHFERRKGREECENKIIGKIEKEGDSDLNSCL